MDRRSFLRTAAAGLAGIPAAGLGSLAAPPGLGAERGEPHSFDLLVDRARELATRPYEPARRGLPPPFADLTRDEYGAIARRPERRIVLGPDGAFAMEPLPPGYLFEDPVRLALVADGRAEWIDFSAGFFRFDRGRFGPERLEGAAAAAAAGGAAGNGEAGFSGFALRHALERPGQLDDWVAFQGASQFRARAGGTGWGASARGVAVGTASSDGEEAPVFTHFWIHAPERDAARLRVHALLDSPSLTGAFAFELAPGAETLATVACRLMPRENVARVGIAPLSSMFFFGPGQRPAPDDVRDAVHDSQGLQMISGRGERIWRPLQNPAALQLSGFLDHDPRAFGLTQRRRDYEYYGDPDAGFERRPSIWVEPHGAWGPGEVGLVEIPVTNALNDNILAFWRPAEPLRAGEVYDFDYDLRWGTVPPDPAPLARVHASRVGSVDGDAPERLVVVDFALGSVAADRLEPRISASRGIVSGLRLVRPPVAGMVRVAFRFAPDGAELSEFRLVLEGPAGPMSETWLHRWIRT